MKATLKYIDKPHVLVVDDDDRIRGLVSRYLLENDFIVVTAQDAAEARVLMQQLEFDALVVDVMMPGETGTAFTRSLRTEADDIPVLLLTALGEAEDRISGLESGADDYLPKPFEPRELVLRLRAILRRKPRTPEGVKAFRLGRWVFDPDQSTLQDGDELVRLTTVESTLLKALAAQDGNIVSRDELAELCEVDAETRAIDVQVTRLRRKIEEDTRAPRYLHTVRGKGYKLLVEDI